MVPSRPTGVVILNYRNWPEVGETIRSIAAQTVPTRIVVVDNASGDGSAENIRRAFPDVDVFETRRNGGYAGGMNQGRRQLPPGPVVFATHELLLPPDGLERMLSHLADGVGAVGPVIRRRDSPDTVFSAGGYLDADRVDVGHHVSVGNEISWLDGGCLLVAEEALRDVGDFDEGYFMYFEDVDFGLRLRDRGWRLACAADVDALAMPGDVPKLLYRRNRLRMARRHLGRDATIHEMRTLAEQIRRDVQGRQFGSALKRIMPALAYVLRVPPRLLMSIGPTR